MGVIAALLPNGAWLHRLRVAVRDRHEVVAWHMLDPLEVDFEAPWGGTLIDAETGQRLNLDMEAARRGYLKQFNTFLEETQNAILMQGGDYALVRTDTSPLGALGQYLARREGFF